MADQDLSKLKVTELREMLKARGLNSVGNKQELIDRLQMSFESSVELDSKLEDELLNDDEFDEKSLLDSTQDDILKSPSGSVTSTSPESSNNSAPKKPISLKRNISVSVPVLEQKTDSIENSSAIAASGDEPEKKVVKLSQLSASERLEMRAKKFGTSAVSSSVTVDTSNEKLQARAARFGITTTATPSSPTKVAADSTKNLELLKKRAERFGAVIVPELKASEEQEKLLKRQERFGASVKSTISAPVKTNLTENEEKALKRLERFKTTA